MNNKPNVNAVQNIMNTQPCIYIPFMPAMPQLAHAYVPFQTISCLYKPMEGLKRGTIFPELDMPYGANPEYTVDA